MILDIVAPGVLLLVIVILLINNLSIRSKNRKLSSEVIQIALDKAAISERLRQELDTKESESIEKSEGFLKFISQSRDWAFDYIEEVQAALLKFKDAVEPQIEYSKTYATSVGESAHSQIVDKIAVAYEELSKAMPTENPSDDVLK
jgi:hypothetical protein